LQLLDPFWPQNLNVETSYGDTSVVLLKQIEHSHCHEKIVKVMKGSETVLNVSLLQIKAWKKK
jgi:tyrosine-protein phosphatase non-receptor type 23